MRRIAREPERFEVLDLFNSLASKQGLSLNDKKIEKTFIDTISNALGAASKNPALLYGRRAEAMFTYLVASLGRASLVKQEDAGEFYAVEANVRAPDLLVVLKSGSSFLVEVKNFHRNPIKPYVLKSAYLQSLAEYGRLTNRPVRLAIYWSKMNTWTLHSLDRLSRDAKHTVIHLTDALKTNEMVDVGDLHINAIPPLVCRILADPSKPHSIDELGNTDFTIGGFEFLSAGMRIEDKNEQNLAFYFMLYGAWMQDGEPRAQVENGNLISIEFIVEPTEPVPEQEFQMLGSLSGMISSQFNYLTAPESALERLTPTVEPGSLGVVIPEGYKGKDLRLFCFRLKPNYD
jgi:hypothetical protein